MRLHHNFYYKPHPFVGYVLIFIIFFLVSGILLRVATAALVEEEQILYQIAQTGASTQR